MEINTGTRKIVTPDSFRSKVSSFIDKMNETIRTEFGKMSVPVVDLHSHFSSPDRSDLLDPRYAIGDNAHLNIEGQKKMARVMNEEYFRECDDFDLVVCLGDSHTQGWPVRTDTSRNGEVIDIELDSPHQYPFWLSKWTGRSFINRGIAGNTYYGMFNRFNNDVVRHFPDHCIVQGGTNDALLGTPFHESFSDLKNIVDLCLENEITPVVCTIIPLGF